MLSVVALLLTVNPHLDEGRALYERLKYPEAEARLKVAATAPENTPAEQAEILDLLARSMLAQGRPADAERTYAELVAAQPHVADPNASPKVKAAFLRAKRSVYPEGFVRLSRRPAAPGELVIELVDPWRAVRAVVLEQKRGAATTTVELKAVVTRYSATIELAPGERVECVVRAKDQVGKQLASLGEEGETIVFQKLAAQPVDELPAPIVTAPVDTGPARWPAIVIGSVAVLALAVGVGLAISAALDSGQVTPSTSALETRTLDARARDKALAANFAIGGGVAAGVVAGVLIWRW